MKLREYLKREGVGAKSRVAREAKVAYTTVLKAESDGLSRRATAEAISAATNGEVSVAELLGIELPTGEAA